MFCSIMKLTRGTGQTGFFGKTTCLGEGKSEFKPVSSA